MYKIESNIYGVTNNQFKVEVCVLKKDGYDYYSRIGYFYEIISPPTWISKKLFNLTFEDKCKKQHDKLLAQAKEFMTTQIAVDKAVEEMRKVVIVHE